MGAQGFHLPLSRLRGMGRAIPSPAMPLIRYTQECIDAANGKWPGIEPGSKRKDRPNNIRVFENRILENVFGKAHWVTPIIWMTPVISFGLYRGYTAGRTVLQSIGLIFVGYLIWTLIEYLLHRNVFHMSAERPEDKLKAFLIHGYHHDFPDDRMRLVAPPVMSWIPTAIIVAGLYLIFGPSYFGPVVAGTAGGYVAYDWIHFYTHHGRPKGGIGKWLRRYHMLHHFKDGGAYYGVSNPLWDFVFGTYKSTKTSAESAEAELSRS